jgi:hypothetical protein
MDPECNESIPKEEVLTFIRGISLTAEAIFLPWFKELLV